MCTLNHLNLNNVKISFDYYWNSLLIKVYLIRSVIFTIDHSRCSGLRLGANSVKAFVLVQESLPILTHSTRRFLVMCHFKPNAFTVKAG